MANKPMSRLQVFIGTWNTTGEVLETEAGPATSLSATDTYRWLPGMHFIVHDADARFGAMPARSMEVIGYDPKKRRHWAQSYDDQGSADLFQVSLKGKKWTIVGESVRFAGKFSADNQQLTGLWEIKGKKAAWQPWIKIKLVRA